MKLSNNRIEGLGQNCDKGYNGYNSSTTKDYRIRDFSSPESYKDDGSGCYSQQPGKSGLPYMFIEDNELAESINTVGEKEDLCHKKEATVNANSNNRDVAENYTNHNRGNNGDVRSQREIVDANNAQGNQRGLKNVDELPNGYFHGNDGTSGGLVRNGDMIDCEKENHNFSNVQRKISIEKSKSSNMINSEVSGNPNLAQGGSEMSYGKVMKPTYNSEYHIKTINNEYLYNHLQQPSIPILTKTQSSIDDRLTENPNPRVDPRYAMDADTLNKHKSSPSGPKTDVNLQNLINSVHSSGNKKHPKPKQTTNTEFLPNKIPTKYVAKNAGLAPPSRSGFTENLGTDSDSDGDIKRINQNLNAHKKTPPPSIPTNPTPHGGPTKGFQSNFVND